ncbi:sigma-70 family RNA polymerase sigma factor [Streptomyces sp. NPDC052013]|uniref:sigma-70 family RNA polymerase sigma factor n=1 Tax=Streptomyces sp. NPDC052013 TaxID=3365679 RepID=UPI0037D148CE
MDNAETQVPTSPDRMSSEADALIQVLYQEHATALFRFVLSLTDGDRHWAEDVVQETLVRAWKHAERLAEMEASGLRPWLVTVARRIVIDGWRARAARPRESDPAPLEMMPGPDEVSRALEVMLVSDALDSLKPTHRTALVETYLKGRTMTQAAAHLGVATSTLKSRVFHGLHALRLVLQEQDCDEVVLG